ncbi:DUF3429 domain-containing protein [Paraburkholderia aromaticivorans]|uniref:DUF3429 domain-containing protein n=1 Tax=Paraburkholderia aromaticivorans TaxID=2026199 RepID=A0A248VQ54_9BURK|nr:DUF3429 domain-containing protein [Paraburkholderia aromaticivorans]ASW01178.1 hypothetical protein CJU94_23565 [Paraburkholderia aromaticivorans]
MTPTATASPGLPIALGLAGAIPFVGLAVLVNTFGAHEAFLRHAMLAYGACIVSFVGAVHWGIWLAAAGSQPHSAMALGWSVLPAVAAWALLAIGTRYALPGMAALLAACLLVDLALWRIDALPGWYLRMRALLTTVGALCLLSAMQ